MRLNGIPKCHPGHPVTSRKNLMKYCLTDLVFVMPEDLQRGDFSNFQIRVNVLFFFFFFLHFLKLEYNCFTMLC